MSAEPTHSGPKTRLQHRAAVIGCGWIGAGAALDAQTVGVQSHAEAYARHSRAALCAVVDPDLGRAQLAASRWNAPSAFQDTAEMLAQVKPELVSICTPDALHASTLRLVLDCPTVKGVLAEKPLALTAKEAVEVAALARSRGIVLAVNYSRRYCPAYGALKRQLQAGALGRIQHVTGYYVKGLIHNGTHWLNLLTYLFGAIQKIQRLPSPDADADTPSVAITLESGVTAMLLGCDTKAFTVFEMDIVGEKGRIRLVDSGHIFEYYAVAPSQLYAGYSNLQPSHIRPRCLKHAMILAVNELIGCVEGRLAAPACPAPDAIKPLQLAEGLLQTSPLPA